MNPQEPQHVDILPAETSAEAAKPPWWKRSAKFIVFRVLFWYFVICLVMMFFQRYLLYHPTRADKISPAEAGLPEGFVHPIAYETADGLTINGWHLLRNGQVCHSEEECRESLSRGKFVVLFFHGNGGDRRGRVDYAQVFTGARADVFLIDYRGYADNPGSPNERGLYEDARGLWNYATKERGVDPGRIVIFGESLGGGVAVQLAQEVCANGTPPAGLIVRSTFSSLADAAGSHYPWLPVRWLLWDRFPSDDAIGDVTCPVLMLHGTKDRIVPFDLGKKLFDLTPEESSAGIAKQFVPLEGADHNGLLFTHKPEFTEAIEGFLKRLPAPDHNE